VAEKIAEEFERFKKFLKRLVAVPKEEIEEKLEEYRQKRGEDDAEPDT
jgi:hypothetical protein